MKIGIGLVIKGGKEYIKDWIREADKIADAIYVIDNGADIEVRNILIPHKKVKKYIVQKDLERNQSRDYQQILDIARDDNCQWIWNLDIDELPSNVDKESLFSYLLNTREQSIGVAIVEMRNDKEHFIMIPDMDRNLKFARGCHKIFKVLSHLEFDTKDKHGISIPHNCQVGEIISIIVLHFGHMTKKLRDEKRKGYEELGFKDTSEFNAIWFEEDESKLEIKHLTELPV